MSIKGFDKTPIFDDCIRKLEKGNSEAIDLLDAKVMKLVRQPFQNPMFKTHSFTNHPSGHKIFISDIGGRKGYRLIWRLVNERMVFLLYGEHDVEERAMRLTIEDDPSTGGVRIVEYAVQDTPPANPRAATASSPGSLFMAWNDDELGRMFEPQVVEVLRGLDDLWELERLEERMSSEDYDQALTLALYHSEDVPVDKRETVERRRDEVSRRAVSDEERDLERKITSPASRKHFAPITPSELSEVLTKPIEDWMVYLHPDQAKLTQRPFSGPARVRGAAGTGKTVVALHRARHLARTYREPILFGTYVRNLPAVYEHLFQRLAPELGGLVEFRGLHSWAFRFLKEQGRPFSLDTQAVWGAFADAWKKVARDGSALEASELSRDYYRDELNWIIKGRGLATIDDYLDLARTGRGTPLPASHRRAVWELYEAYEDQLRRRGTIDFNDLLLRALEVTSQERFESPYRAVLIDEAQDLTEVGLRLAHRLAGGDQRDGLFLVGDGQQSIYPGGYNLSQIGIDVRGRSTVLDVNYRNTDAIVDFARHVVDGHAYDDGGDMVETGRDRSVTVTRTGTSPQVRSYREVDDHDLGLAGAIDDVCSTDDVAIGDVAVLVPTNAMVKKYRSRIEDLGYPTQKLRDYDGVTTDKVKVGTYPRAKGLEFKHVFMPRLEAERIGETRRAGEDEHTHAERMDLLRRQLWVSMTRARDGLWLGWVGEPSSLIEPCLATTNTT